MLSGAAGPGEQARLEHRLLSFVPLDQTFSAGAFAERARAEVDGALAAGRRPLVVGGTGLYLQAALTDLELRPPADDEVRSRLEADLAARGSAALHADLAVRDEQAAERDRARRPHAGAARARAARDGGGTGAVRGPVAALDGPPQASDAPLRPRDGAHAPCTRGSTSAWTRWWPRGRRSEVRRAAAADASRTARAALGFAELLDGDVEAMKRRTRNYAKRSHWLRRLPDVHVHRR